MNNQEKLHLLQKWENHYRATDAAYEMMSKAFNANPESPAVEPMWRLFDDYTNLIANVIGDDFDWMGWYHCDNGFGEKGLSAKASSWKKMRKIDNLKMLLKLIEDSK